MKNKKPSAQKVSHQEENKSPIQKQVANLMKPKTPAQEPNEFSFNKSPIGRGKSPNEGRDSSGSKNKVKFSDAKSYQSGRSHDNSEGKASTKSDNLHHRGGKI